MIDTDKDLEEIFENAIMIAIKNKHEYITLEHFLLSIVSNEEFCSLLTDFGTDVEVLKDDIQHYIEYDLKDIINPDINKPKKTNVLDKVINRAFTNVLLVGKHIIEPIDCFLSILSEKNTHAVYLLKKANIDIEND